MNFSKLFVVKFNTIPPPPPPRRIIISKILQIPRSSANSLQSLHTRSICFSHPPEAAINLRPMRRVQAPFGGGVCRAGKRIVCSYERIRGWGRSWRALWRVGEDPLVRYGSLFRLGMDAGMDFNYYVGWDGWEGRKGVRNIWLNSWVLLFQLWIRDIRRGTVECSNIINILRIVKYCVSIWWIPALCYLFKTNNDKYLILFTISQLER